MPQFGRFRVVSTLALWSVLLCLGFAGCEETTTPPGGWGDLQTEPIVPETRPADAVCEGDWCWLNPSPFGYTVRELRTVGGQVYGVGGQSIGGRGKPFIWSEEFEFVDIPAEIQDDGPQFDVSIGEDAWLAVTQEAKVYEFGPDGVKETFQLPDVYPLFIEGHSTSLFIVATQDSGVFIRRNGELIHREQMHRFIADDRIWPNGDVWSIVESDQPGTRSEDWERRFPAPVDESSDVETPRNVLEIGPDPSGPCASLGIWASVTSGGLKKWNESNQSWIDAMSPDKPGLTDFTCRDDGTLLASSAKAGIYANADGSWERFRPEVDASLRSTTILNGTVYAGGSRGTLIEASESNSHRLGRQILDGDLFEGPLPNMGIWVSPDETSAMAITRSGVHEWTAEGTKDVSSGVERPGGGLGGGLGASETHKIWGESQPQFAITPRYVLRWTGSKWKESSLSAQRNDEEFQPIAIAGRAADDVVIATARDLFHYDGSSWREISADGTNIHEFIEDLDVGIRDVIAETGSGYLVALGADIYSLQKTGGSWELEFSRDTPCERAGTLYRAGNGDLWVSGTSQCFARSTGNDWQTYDVPPSIQLDWPDDQDPQTTSLGMPAANFVEQPNTSLPLIGTHSGLLQPTEDGELELVNRNQILDLGYLPEAGVTLAITFRGILAKYH